MRSTDDWTIAARSADRPAPRPRRAGAELRAVLRGTRPLRGAGARRRRRGLDHPRDAGSLRGVLGLRRGPREPVDPGQGRLGSPRRPRRPAPGRHWLGWLGWVPRVTSTWFVSEPWWIVSVTLSPGLWPAMAATRPSPLVTGAESTAVIRSPARTPAPAAGLAWAT